MFPLRLLRDTGLHLLGRLGTADRQAMRREGGKRRKGGEEREGEGCWWLRNWRDASRERERGERERGRA